MYKFYVDKMAEMVQSQTHEIQTKAGDHENVRPIEARGIVVTGVPSVEILECAEENNIDIILMATHGALGVRRWALGSVAYQVLHASKIPVLLVRAGFQLR